MSILTHTHTHTRTPIPTQRHGTHISEDIVNIIGTINVTNILKVKLSVKSYKHS